MNSFGLTSAMEYQDQDNRTQLEQCIMAMVTGDMGAVAELYRRTKAGVYGFSLSILKNTHDAEDVLQETYIRIYAAADRYEVNGNPMPWIFTIARNLSLMKLRERKKTEEFSEEDSGLFSIEAPACTAEDRFILSAAMKLLSDEERQIVMLHAVSGFKHREISALLELPLSTVLSKYRRAIRKLRIGLEESE